VGQIAASAPSAINRQNINSSSSDPCHHNHQQQDMTREWLVKDPSTRISDTTQDFITSVTSLPSTAFF
jgi:hypothetical protein